MSFDLRNLTQSHLISTFSSETGPIKWTGDVELTTPERILAADNGFHHSLPVFSVDKLLSLSKDSTLPPSKFDHVADFKVGLVHRGKEFSAKRIKGIEDHTKGVDDM